MYFKTSPSNYSQKQKKILICIFCRGQGSAVCIVTRYGLDGPGIRSLWGARFFAPFQISLGGSPSLLYNGYWVFPWSKTAGTWSWTPIPSSAEVKERVELYLYSTSGPSWPVLGWTLPFYFMYILPKDFWNKWKDKPVPYFIMIQNFIQVC